MLETGTVTPLGTGILTDLNPPSEGALIVMLYEVIGVFRHAFLVEIDIV
ncbi:MAG: hypothetical protein AVDCRST_MAG56-5047 [uncultured Cytophagales bacterium]|uniref:Uncharacterized protein n=1 Tax=uncultured Cytophagales bacterium TaxID=158755 RepID=A0A6J4K5T0_9SPHI|nr:MAG: hypothetical protein AVDCRST_MAG56-5047 [uncultured Cytophagales bacterium]